jgi:hypothetical protein
MGMRRMKVDKLGIDLLTHDPVVILKDMEGKRHLPILIGPFEATAIALALEGTQVPRPLSHDLMKSVIEALKAKGWNIYTFIGAGGARFVCAWNTTVELLDQLLADVKAVLDVRA